MDPRERSGAQRLDPDAHINHDGHIGESRTSIVNREKQEHGGIKIGSAFFGWLTATGMSVLLTALVSAAGTAVGLATKSKVEDVTSAASSNPDTIGILGGIILLVILFVSYYCGGYVAGRMARFNGIKQGLAVWLWAILIAITVAIVAAVAGSKYDILSKLDSFPRIPVSGDTLSTAGIIALVVIIIATLLGALLGGLAGMRFHRNVDKTGLPG